MQNIIAFTFPICLFLYWSIVGYATINLLHTQRNTIQNLLISPAVGIAITLLPIFWLSRAGIPVSHFGPWLSILFLISCAIILLYRKPLLPFFHYLPFVGIFFLGLFLTGRPLLEFGFNWISYGNDDMANYCLRALRFLHHGYLEPPNLNDLIQGSDYSLLYWFWDVPGVTRAGADLLLANVSSLVHLSPFKIFMPFTLGLYLCFMSAAAGLIYQSRNWRKITIFTTFLLALSPLTTFGVLSQLIGQMVGLALLCVSYTLLLHPFSKHQRYDIFRLSLLLSIVLAALLICYPEVIPFLVLVPPIFFTLHLLQGWKITKKFLLILLLTFILLLVFLNSYCLTVLSFIAIQSFYAFTTITSNIFPYFLHLTGLSDLWGLQVVSIPPAPTWRKLSLFISIILMASSLLISFIFLKKKSPIAIIFLVMMGLGIFLLKHENGFSLFKLAMYIQPFLLCMTIIGIFYFFSSHFLRLFLIIALALVNIYNQSFYVEFSRGSLSSPFVEFPTASQTHLLDNMIKISKQIKNDQNVILDTPHLVAAKLLAGNMRNKKTLFISDNFFIIPNHKAMSSRSSLIELIDPQIINFYNQTGATIDKINSTRLKPVYFSLHTQVNPNSKNIFYNSISPPSSNSMLIISSPLRTIFNRRHFSETNKINYLAMPWKNVKNILIFIHSQLGQNYYYNNDFATPISIYNLEKDYFFNNNSFARVGRYLTFRAVNPDSNVRFELSLTSSLNHDMNNNLPFAAVIGASRYPVPLVGRGSAHVFTSLIKPQLVENTPYFMIDLGDQPDHGVNKNSTVPAYVRNISLIGENEYRQLSPPSFINKFPIDLSNPNLEYSGMYEDGWISENAFFKLKQSKENNILKIQGLIPKIDKEFISTQLTLLIDGKQFYKKDIFPGDFDIHIPMVNNQKNINIELHFSKTQHLSQPDNRIIVAKIKYLGF